ncbi:MAG TPA: NADP-dependent malic enzyme [Patescibacteria group bacterium]
MDYASKSLQIHKKLKGKIGLLVKVPLRDKFDLSIAYTPGVAAVSSAVAKDPTKAYEFTIKANSVAVVSDGSAVLGLGNIGPLGALPVMEGKSLLFKSLGNIDSFPIVLDVHETDEIVKVVRAIAPTYGGINLEDIAAPKCFEVEAKLQDIGIPVFHDDQHGTAIVVAAALINALKAVGKKIEEIRIVISGAGAAGNAVAKILIKLGVGDLILIDSNGAIYQGRGNLDPYKVELAAKTNHQKKKGNLAEVIAGADVFIGVSAPGVLKEEDVAKMAKRAIVFAMANPIPEIMPDLALKGGAELVATGRSDFPNQINNVLVFPGVFRGALDSRAKRITEEMKLATVYALAGLVKKPSRNNILPYALDKKVVPTIANAVAKAYKQ